MEYVRGDIELSQTTTLERKILLLFRSSILDEKEDIPYDFRVCTTTSQWTLSTIRCPYSGKMYPLLVRSYNYFNWLKAVFNYSGDHRCIELYEN